MTVATRSGQAAHDAKAGEFEPAKGVVGDDDEWEDVSLEGGDQIKWDDTPSIEGVFKGSRDVVSNDGEIILMLIFEDRELGRCFAWAGPKLKEAFANVAPGSYVRVAMTGEKNVGKPSPMKMFKVMVHKGGVDPTLPPRGPGSYTTPDGETF